MISTFLHFIRKKINPSQSPLQSPLQSQLQKYIEKEEKEYDETKEETIQSDISGTIDNPVENPGTEEPGIYEKKRIYACIDNDDLPQRVQHNICNLIGLDKEELAYIKEMNCKSMFEIVKLLNKAVVSLVDGIMEID